MRKLLVVFLACAALVGVAAAQPIFSFDITSVGGLMSYNGTTASISSVPIIDLTVTGAPLNNGSYLIDGTITGGACTASAAGSCGVASSTTGAQTFASGPFAAFGPGGSLLLTGSLDNLAGTNILPTGSIISSGTYTGAFLNTSTMDLEIAGNGKDFKDPIFLAYFGITDTTFLFGLDVHATPPPGYVVNTNFLLPPNTFSGAKIQTGNITNTAAEPSALLLLGAGLLVGAGLLRRVLG